ncbi:hypothetical protein FB446DRAFT_62858 [Lentinula raphanica]|nr:hypothetical protein FB446DRAFT_62858 [Lentinula raphanica]
MGNMTETRLGSPSPLVSIQGRPAVTEPSIDDGAIILHKRSAAELEILYQRRKLRQISDADGCGTLYAYLDNGIQWKVGMTIDFPRRKAEWDRECPCPRRIWMDPIPVAYRRRAESLAHLLIEDICTDRPRRYCVKCQRKHQEVFTFRVADTSRDSSVVWNELLYPILS